MISKCYKIADKSVEINSLYEEVHEYCKEYLTEEKPDYSESERRVLAKFPISCISKNSRKNVRL